MKTFVKTQATPRGEKIVSVAQMSVFPDEPGWIEIQTSEWEGWKNSTMPERSPFLSAQGRVIWIDARDLEVERQKKRAQIDSWRLKANSSGFTYQGKTVSTDTLSMLDISNAAIQISALNAMPVDWPGGWKAKEGFIPISTVAEWNSFFNAMYSQGLANFNKSRALKELVNGSNDIQFIKSLTWDSL